MSATSKVDAIQASVLKAAKAAIASYVKNNVSPKGAVNKPPRGFVEKIIRSRLDSGALVKAFVDDALDAVGE